MVPSIHSISAGAIERSNGAHHEVKEEALRALVPLTVTAVLCVLGSIQGQTQEAVCGVDNVCMTEAPTGEVTGVEQRSGAAKLPSLVGPYRCPGMPVDVTAASSDERRLVCSAADRALQLLGRCGISPRRPLKVHIMSEVRHPFSGAILGLFDPKQERVLVTQEVNISSLVKDTPFAKLPQRDFYRSLIVHEVIHGVMHQNLKRSPVTHAAYEYPAYALQIESLAPHVRETFLQSFDQTASKAGTTLFSDAVLFFDPYYFAASAHQHFKASDDGCAHLTALLEGEVPFMAPPQM